MEKFVFSLHFYCTPFCIGIEYNVCIIFLFSYRNSGTPLVRVQGMYCSRCRQWISTTRLINMLFFTIVTFDSSSKSSSSYMRTQCASVLKFLESFRYCSSVSVLCALTIRLLSVLHLFCIQLVSVLCAFCICLSFSENGMHVEWKLFHDAYCNDV